MPFGGSKPLFKKCGACGYRWRTRDHFLTDPNLQIVGYQSTFERFKPGLLLFNHSCYSTLSIPLIHFEDLCTGPLFLQRGKSRFPDNCMYPDGSGHLCPGHCECACVEQIIREINGWPKTGRIQSSMDRSDLSLGDKNICRQNRNDIKMG